MKDGGKTSSSAPSAKDRKTGGARCPICNQGATEKYRPFCSRRCADVDLHRWLGGNYRVATDERPGEAETGDDPDGF